VNACGAPDISDLNQDANTTVVIFGGVAENNTSVRTKNGTGQEILFI
jgi:hypothetical protein